MKFFLYSKSFRILLVVCFFQLVLAESVFAVGQQVSTTNLHITQSKSTINISYDLLGDAEQYATVELVMLRKSDRQFRYHPQRVSGDIGHNVQVGNNRSLEWDTREEFPAGLVYDDIYFTLNTADENGTSISPWIWVAGVIVVGVIVYFIAKKPATENSGEFPQPPGRP